MASELAGYVTDIPYVRGFKPMLAPAWLDVVALIGGYEPPDRQGGFSWCDLGCGQGVTAAILAATHPAGNFHGIDAMPVHVAHAERLAHDAGTGNARFHACDFGEAGRLGLPHFDYIVAHGVYSWIDPEVRAALRRFVDAHLKSGGLFYVSYNAMPGWTGDLPFQYLVRELAGGGEGDSAARFADAASLIDQLASAGANRLADSYIVRELRQRPEEYRPGYLVHEFMHTGWQALYVTELRHDLATIDLAPVGSATLVENFDAWILGRRGRALVGAVADPDRRELLRDFLTDQRFRCDVFTRDAPPLDAREQRDRLAASGLALVRPPSAIGYEMPIPAGRLSFETPAARAVVAGLADGARTLSEIAADGISRQDLLANALALCAAGDVRPAETARVPVAALNRALRRRIGTAEEIPALALPCGTALEIGHDLLGLMQGGAEARTAWQAFLALHEV